jgi:L,D-transpeptidase catalytic domain
MTRGRSWVVAAVVAGGLVVGLAPSALATADAITLAASRTHMVYGQNTKLSGEISADGVDPPPPAQTVEIVDVDTAEVLAATSTDDGGLYLTQLDEVPDENHTVVARWAEAGVESEPVVLRVEPVLDAKLTRPRLFGTVKVRGSIGPPRPGDEVIVTLFRGGQAVKKQTVGLKDGGTSYTATFQILKTGTYRGRAKFADQDLATAIAWTKKRSAPLPPNLSSGSTGIYTKLLETRLRQLHYRLPKPNKHYDHRTEDAVTAFHKVQKMPRSDSVSAKTWKRLQKPIRAKPRAKKRPFHIEIDQTRQVLYVVDGGKIKWIVHTSTGKASTPTRDGVFYVHRKIAGYSPNRLYYPSYFDGNRAVHGWPQVPTYPASHGCARVPYWNAIWLHNLMPMGTQVRVYHS